MTVQYILLQKSGCFKWGYCTCFVISKESSRKNSTTGNVRPAKKLYKKYMTTMITKKRPYKNHS